MSGIETSPASFSLSVFIKEVSMRLLMPAARFESTCSLHTERKI